MQCKAECQAAAQPGCRGWCQKHYSRWRRHGDPEKVNKRGRGSAEYGHSQGYAAIHARLSARRGKAADQKCACGQQAVQWAYQYSASVVLYTHDGMPFSPELDAYSPMCARCHHALDAEHAWERDWVENLPRSI